MNSLSLNARQINSRRLDSANSDYADNRVPPASINDNHTSDGGQEHTDSSLAGDYSTAGKNDRVNQGLVEIAATAADEFNTFLIPGMAILPTNCLIHKQRHCRKYEHRQRRVCLPDSKIRSNPGHSVDLAASERRAARYPFVYRGVR